ncbi:MAG TPA: site-specific integrase [Gemmataceae bacterium]|nr:site-specific integrase [Gemmataceae bacterium]
MSAWIYQDDKQVKKVGEAKAAYYVGWIDPEGKRRCKSCGTGAAGKKAAEKLRQKREGELREGTYKSNSKKTWDDFHQEYKDKILPKKAPRSRAEILTSLAHVKRIMKPNRMAVIKTQAIDEYVAKRRLEPGKKKGDLVSPATVNKELRHLRAALKKASRWGYLDRMPDFEFEREPQNLPTYIIPEHFATIYAACDHARMPADQPYPAADWWRGLLVMAYMTGWRISELLAVSRTDVDLDAGTAITRWEDNKGKRDDKAKLHPVVVEHLRKLTSFDPGVFPWNHDRRTLQTEFANIQEKAGIHLPCHDKHEHTRFCHVYGFHDLRRAFATMNADKLTPEALQRLMRHKSFRTTLRYINTARQLDEAVGVLHVPDVLKAAKGMA